MGQNGTRDAAMRLARSLMSIRSEVQSKACNPDDKIKDWRWKKVYELLCAFEDSEVRDMIKPEVAAKTKNGKKKPTKKNLIASGEKKRRGAPGIHKGNHPWRRRAAPKT